jgi:hypothetical protein
MPNLERLVCRSLLGKAEHRDFLCRHLRDAVFVGRSSRPVKLRSSDAENPTTLLKGYGL